VLALQKKGKKVGVVTRGYKATYYTRKPYVAYASYDVRWLGDEGALIGERCHCPVVAYHDRFLAAQALMKAYQPELIIFDDGLQYRTIDFSLKICLFNRKIAVGNGYMIPGGPLRAPLSSMEGVDFILNIAGAQPALVKKNYFWVYHSVTKEERLLSSFQRCTLIIGIADPDPVIQHVKRYNGNIEIILLNDHQSCSLGFLKEALLFSAVIMTEKDWIKIKSHLDINDDVWILPLMLEVHPVIEEALLTKIMKDCL
jgi:tetraacyldisaccharide 4'-kinase